MVFHSTIETFPITSAGGFWVEPSLMFLGLNLYLEFWVESSKKVTGGTFIRCSTKNRKGFSYGRKPYVVLFKSEDTPQVLRKTLRKCAKWLFVILWACWPLFCGESCQERAPTLIVWGSCSFPLSLSLSHSHTHTHTPERGPTHAATRLSVPESKRPWPCKTCR